MLILKINLFSIDNSLDSLEKNYSKFDNKSKLEALLDLSAGYVRKEPKKTIKFANLALNLAEIMKNDSAKSDALLRIGFANYFLSNFDTALVYYYRTIEIKNKLKDYKGLADAYNDIGIISKNKGNYKSSLENHFQALRFREMIKDSLNIARSFNNIGNVYYFLKEVPKALEYFSKGLDIKLSLNDTKTISTSYNNMGMVYYNMNQYDKAIACYTKSFENDKKTNNLKGMSSSYNNLANIYSDQKEYKKALENYNNAYKIDLEINNTTGMVTSLINIGSVNIDLKDYRNAIEHIDEAITIAKKENFIDLLKEAYYFNYLANKEFGNFQKALQSHENYKLMQDSIFNIDNSEKINELSLKYETNNKIKEIELLKKNQEIEKSWNYAKTIAIILFSIILFLLLLGYRIKFKANNLLKEKNFKIESQNSDLEKLNSELSGMNQQLTKLNSNLSKSEEHLKELNATKDKFFSIVSFDLRNSLTEFITSSELMIHYFDLLDKDQIIAYLKRLSSSSYRVNKIIDNLLLWSRSQTNSFEFNPDNIKVKLLIVNSLSSVSDMAKSKNIEIQSEIDNELSVYGDIQMLSIILRNLITNAIKYSFPNNKVEVKAVKDNKFVRISIIDFGTGINSENLQKLFKIEHHFNVKGTEKEEGTGLGLVIAKDFIDRNGGAIFVESKESEGSIFTISIPVDSNL
jgi:signal transduction histidine kinase/tetratricopeptide (TPR) repeat protein